MASVPKRKIRIPSTTIVYGSLSASLTIHIMIHIPNSVRHGRTSSTNSTLRPVLRSPDVQGGNHSLGCRRRRDFSRQNYVPCRNFLAVHTPVVAVLRSDRGSFQRNTGKQATRSRVSQ